MKEANKEIDERLRGIFADVLDLEPGDIDLGLNPDTVEDWDSMSHIKLVAGIEQEFSIRLSPEEQTDMLSYELALDLVSARLAG